MGMIRTIYGDRDESLYEKREGVIDNENETTAWVEYWFHGVEVNTLVHRSAHTTLKRKAGVEGQPTVGSF